MDEGLAPRLGWLEFVMLLSALGCVLRRRRP
jgi:hypothetical protein